MSCKIILLLALIFHIANSGEARCRFQPNCKSAQCSTPKCAENQEVYADLCRCCPGCRSVLKVGDKCRVNFPKQRSPCPSRSTCKWISRNNAAEEGLSTWGWRCVLEKFVGGMK